LNNAGRNQVFWPADGRRAVLYWQAGAGLAGMAVVALWLGNALALGLAYGVLLSIINSAWMIQRIGYAASLDPENGQRVLYAGAAFRFAGVLAALLLAYGLGLHLLAVAGGMLLVQIASFAYVASHTGSDTHTGLSVTEESERE